jgi:hypothetical protein
VNPRLVKELVETLSEVRDPVEEKQTPWIPVNPRGTLTGLPVQTTPLAP